MALGASSLTISRKATAKEPLKIQRQKCRTTVAVQFSCLENFATDVKQSRPLRLIIKLADRFARQSTTAVADRPQSLNKVRQLGLCMQNYESIHRNLPPASNFEYVDAAGVKKRSKHSHSWRVDILPLLEHEDLWKQYRFEEPWDSDANKKVLAAMPDVFCHPQDKPGSTNTSYFAITGPETVFDGETGAKFEDITDGLANTVMLVEAKRAVPWTKPEDIPYANDKPIEKMSGWFEGIFIAAFADGSVHNISESIEESTLRAMITKNGGENIPK